VAYAGRWVGDPKELPEGEGKWKLPPKFEKSRVLFNLHRVENPSRLILVEGFFPAIRLHGLGYPVVALMGHALSEQHLELLEGAGTRHLVLMLDGDEPGRATTARIMGRLADASFLTLAAGLPTGMQPDTVAEPLLRDLLGLRA